MTGTIQVWHIYTLGFVGALVEVFNWPARSALIPRLVPPSYMMNAVTLNTIIIQTSFLLGPALGGVLIDQSGLVSTYFLTIAMFIPSGIAIFSMRTSGVPEGERRRVNLKSIFEGIEFIWIQRIILSLFLLDFGVTLVGFYKPILPIFAADVFKTGASGLGILYGAPSLGAIVGSVVLLMIGNVKRMGVLVVVRRRCLCRQPGASGRVQLVLDGGGHDANLGLRRLGERRDPPHSGANARPRRHAWARVESDHRLRPGHQRLGRRPRRLRRPTSRCPQRAPARQCALLGDDPGNLLGHTAIVALSVVALRVRGGSKNSSRSNRSKRPNRHYLKRLERFELLERLEASEFSTSEL